MARRLEGRTFNISVIGLSGTEKEKGQYGVGKSCLCNRFLNQVADGYYQEHISVLSQSDFAGRVINNDHFLYWGAVTKTDDGNNFTFQVIEQTEFIDDVSFSPFKTARTEAYVKRAVSSKVQSAEKLMYICKDQLGMETDSAYPQVVLPEGKLTIDGFLCCFDVSKVPQRSIEKQVEFVAALLNNALKTKKPVVLATTKGESSCPDYMKEAERLISRKEFKGNVPLVETSAHENINIESAFMLLAHLIDKTKGRTKILPFTEARKQRHELLDVAKEAYINLLRTNVLDSKAVWNVARRKLESESDFAHYVDMFGSEQAKKEFGAHTKRLRDELVRSKEQKYLSFLPELLKHFIPSLDCLNERGWNTIRRLIKEHSDFNCHFVMVEEEGCSSWKQVDYFLDDVSENRIPFDLLNSTEAEMCFRNHLNELQAHHRKMELQRQFKKLLKENSQVTPGKPLSETYVFFIGKECYSSLDESERARVYERHMEELRFMARANFQELLWEKSHVFLGWNTAKTLTSKDLQSITSALEDDNRYKALHRLDEDRNVMILNHLGFMQSPSRERCSYLELCIDTQVENLLASRAIRPDIKSSSDSIDSTNKTLNLVILGKDGLARSLNKEIRNICTDDEYSINNTIYSLDYRPIDGDVSREQNALATANFKPHGCLCVYDSEETLAYVKESLECSLTNDVVKDGDNTLRGMPIAIIQACSYGQGEGDKEQLREKGKSIAARLHGEFIPHNEDDGEENGLFVVDQIHLALRTVINACSPGLNGWYLSDQFEPDIRLSMCLMCGDPFPLEVPLGPLLNHDMCRVLADTPYCITLDLFLESTKQKVEIEVASYHGGNRLHQGLFHGHILVYSAKRKASIATLRAFTDSLLNVPKLILAVADSGGVSASFFSNDICQTLIQEGNQLADSIGASFMTTTANFSQQTAVFLPFFKTVWEKREESEMLYHETSNEPCPPVYNNKSYYITRPPPPLPKQYVYHTHKSSTSNSTDSEPVYDQPNLFHSHYSDSDREGDRGSSASPPLINQGEELYTEIITNDDQLVKPSMVKARKNVYAAMPPTKPNLAGNKWEHRKSLPIMSTMYLSLEASTTSSSSNGNSSNNIFTCNTAQPQESKPLIRDPQEFFRKSCSMKIAAEEAVEAGDEADEEESERHRETLALKKEKAMDTRGWPESNASGMTDSFGQHYGSSKSQNILWSENELYQSALSRRKLMNTRSQSQSAAMFRSSPGQVTAPLAIPEPIEIADYCNVKDAVKPGPAGDGDYQIVEDALPSGQIHRIRSTKSPIRVKGRTDSEDSEYSSLEREKYKATRKSIPHRRKSKQRSQDREPIYASPMPSDGKPKHIAVGGKVNRAFAQNHSPSEDGSEGTGDEILSSKKERRRRSFNHRKWRTPSSSLPNRDSSPAALINYDQIVSRTGHGTLEDMSFSNPVIHRFNTIDARTKHSGTNVGGRAANDNEFDLTDSGNWSNRLRGFKTLRDPEKQKKKKDERRRQKEEEKRAKEAQKKTKKKDSKSMNSTSGCSLEDEPTAPDNPSVPLFVHKCVSYIEAEGMATEGLYRIPGNKAQGELFSSKFAADNNVDISSLEIPINAIATLLKSFFSDLNEALIPSNLCDELMEAAEMSEKSGRLLMLRGVIKKLPHQNYYLLKYLISHLYRVAENHKFNSMNSVNLAKCWWPTLMRLQFKSYEKLVQGLQAPEDIIHTLIEQSQFFFHGGNEV